MWGAPSCPTAPPPRWRRPSVQLPQDRAGVPGEIGPLGGGVLLGEAPVQAAQGVVGGGYWTEEDAPYPEGCGALWERLTEGAVS